MGRKTLGRTDWLGLMATEGFQAKPRWELGSYWWEWAMSCSLYSGAGTKECERNQGGRCHLKCPPLLSISEVPKAPTPQVYSASHLREHSKHRSVGRQVQWDNHRAHTRFPYLRGCHHLEVQGRQRTKNSEWHLCCSPKTIHRICLWSDVPESQKTSSTDFRSLVPALAFL